MSNSSNLNSIQHSNLYAFDPYVDQSQCANIDCSDSISGWLCDLVPTAIRHSLLPAKRFGLQSGPNHDPKANRKKEFAAGRFCTAQLLSQWNEAREVGSAEDRSPIWPTGFVGSISHSSNWVWASVARSIGIRSIGIDTEVIVDPKTRSEIQTQIAQPGEWDLIKSLGLDPETEFTVLFSAKEAFYKCWYQVSKQYFDFKNVILEACNEESLLIRATPDNPIFELQPTSLVVHYLAESKDVFTVTWMSEKA